METKHSATCVRTLAEARVIWPRTSGNCVVKDVRSGVLDGMRTTTIHVNMNSRHRHVNVHADEAQRNLRAHDRWLAEARVLWPRTLCTVWSRSGVQACRMAYTHLFDRFLNVLLLPPFPSLDIASSFAFI